ncbi:MAG: UDP-galactopyranose mutase [Verrucomicrobiota bacterium]
MSRPRYVVVGAGLSGAVLARQLVTALDCEVTILEERSHIAGHCHTARDPRSGVMIHQYGPHIFNTDRDDVWEYVNRFAQFMPFVNRVKAATRRGIFSLPINLHTINQFFGKTFNPTEARAFIASLGDKSIVEPKNFEEQALKFLGRDLYETFFYGYTKKQWGCEPRELPASILKRLPVRFDYNDNYYNSAHQGIPADGYTEMIRGMLEHERIAVALGTRFERGASPRCDHLFYSGPLDAYFDFKLGRLGYRTVTFERIDAVGDYQGNALMNYPELDVAHTRIHEHKHFAPWEKHDVTVAFREFAQETSPDDLPFYPKRLAADMALLQGYMSAAQEENNVTFMGRLGTYRYLNMDQVIGETLDLAALFIQAQQDKKRAPVFGIPPA